jgi:hypothetical protein
MTPLRLRKSIDQSLPRHGFLLLSVTLVLAWLALAPAARAVCQDACLTNFNTVQGDDALISLTSGVQNTAIGVSALRNNTTGGFNTATGVNALISNTSGTGNTATGVNALFLNNGTGNTATGFNALINNTSGIGNTATGFNALPFNNTGVNNTANGVQALFSNTTGFNNTANGYNALFSNTTGDSNTANGLNALFSNTTGVNNTANGFQALSSNTSGIGNTATGRDALFSNSTGGNNIALGFGAGGNLTTGSNNIDIGNNGVAAESNTIRIGTLGTQTATYLAGITGKTTPKGMPVFINANGQLGTNTSSERFKDAIKPMDKASEVILALKPVTFHYKKELDPESIPQFGLVAEQVEKVNPDLVVRDGDGKPYTVRYEAVNAMLLNEFLKEHRRVEALQASFAQQQKDFQATVAQQQKQIEALTAGLQKVSAQVEASKPAPQVVNNP